MQFVLRRKNLLRRYVLDSVMAVIIFDFTPKHKSIPSSIFSPLYKYDTVTNEKRRMMSILIRSRQIVRVNLCQLNLYLILFLSSSLINQNCSDYVRLHAISKAHKINYFIYATNTEIE
jgi:hypothetical protein